MRVICNKPAAEMRKFLVKPGELLVSGWGQPIHGSQNDTEAVAGQRHGCRRLSFYLNGVFHGADENRAFHHRDDNAASGEIRYSFLNGSFRCILCRGPDRRERPKDEKENQPEGDCRCEAAIRATKLSKQTGHALTEQSHF